MYVGKIASENFYPYRSMIRSMLKLGGGEGKSCRWYLGIDGVNMRSKGLSMISDGGIRSAVGVAKYPNCEDRRFVLLQLNSIAGSQVWAG